LKPGIFVDKHGPKKTAFNRETASTGGQFYFNDSQKI
jgi:hypothetical protein